MDTSVVRKALSALFPAIALTVVMVPPQRSDAAQFDRVPFGDLTDVRGHGFILRADDRGGVACNETHNTTDVLSLHRDQSSLRPISPVRLHSAGGLQITLRATGQLDSFPEAREAFVRAAARWEELIKDQISIIIDVDFGPNAFGAEFPEGVVGATSSQLLLNQNGYGQVRSNLISGASTEQELSLYNTLPGDSIPTDVGSMTAMVATSANLRALSILGPVPMPGVEPGSPPAIAFNSQFNFDFDPSDGIAANAIDFDAVAVHEMGHALGFSSFVGALELGFFIPALTVWDLFRFRPGTGPMSFTTGARIITSGGDQIFFAGGPEVPLSTGRPDGSGGDEFQASHWKDDSLTGFYVGVMDPAIAPGERNEITSNDVEALEAMGYNVESLVPPTPPSVSALSANLVGNTLMLTGAGADPNADVTLAHVTLLDGSGPVTGGMIELPVDSGFQTAFDFNVQIAGMEQFPAALMARLELLDRVGNRSDPETADFSQADAGGPTINSVNLAPGERMVLKGAGFAAQQMLEVNGVVVAPPLNFKAKPSGGKVKIPGTQSMLNLRPGPNRIRVLAPTGKSNIFVLIV